MKAWLRAAWEPASAATCVCLLLTLVTRPHPAVAVAQGVVCCLSSAWAGWRVTRSRAGGLVSAMAAGLVVPVATLMVYAVLGAAIGLSALALDPDVTIETDARGLLALGGTMVVALAMGLLGGWRGAGGKLESAG